MSRNKRYDEEFKKTIVDLYNSGKSATELEREYGISRTAVYEWIKLYTPIEMENGEITNNKEIQALKKELARIREENEILKKQWPYSQNNRR